MQDFWLLNGFFVMLGLVYLIVALGLILRSKSRNSRNRGLVTLPSKSKKAIGYNLLITGLLISCTAGLLLIFGQNLNLLVAAAINLTITLLAQRIQIFSAPLSDSEPVPMSSNLPTVPIATPQNLDPDLETPTPKPEISDIPAPDRTNLQPRRPSVEISPEIYAELVEISSDPSAAVEEAIRWWLRRRLVDVNTDSNRPSLRSSESWRSQQNKWND